MIHRFNAVPVNILTGYREEHDKVILKFKTNGQKMSKKLLNNHLKGDAIPPDCKAFQKKQKISSNCVCLKKARRLRE